MTRLVKVLAEVVVELQTNLQDLVVRHLRDVHLFSKKAPRQRRDKKQKDKDKTSPRKSKMKSSKIKREANEHRKIRLEAERRV